MTTNEVKRLAAGQGCEAFVTSLQGKIIGYIVVHVAEDGITVGMDPAARSWRWLISGSTASSTTSRSTIGQRRRSSSIWRALRPAELIRRAGGRLPEDVDHAHVMTVLEGSPVRVVRESPTVLPGFTVIGERAAALAVKACLLRIGQGLGLVEVDPESYEVLRIEAGTPVFGKDVTDKNLPQEIGRDDRAISFVKGCYLGQETVARIDALGHVNQVLKGLRFAERSPCPKPGSPLEADGKRVGMVTSAAFSPVRNAPVALGLVRTTHARAGTTLCVPDGDGSSSLDCAVSDLPMSDRR